MNLATVERDLAATNAAIGVCIAEAMASKDITTEELARQIPLGVEALENRLQWGIPFTLAEVAHIANVLGVTAFELLEAAAWELPAPAAIDGEAKETLPTCSN